MLKTMNEPTAISAQITAPVTMQPIILPSRYWKRPSGFASRVDATPSRSSFGISNVSEITTSSAAMELSTRATSIINSLWSPMERTS